VQQLVDGETTTDDPVDPLADFMNSLDPAVSAAFESALLGTEEDPGCLPAAQQKLYGDSGVIDPQIMAIYDDVSARVLADSDMAPVLANWSACMSERGFDVATPDQLFNQMRSLVQRMVDRMNALGALRLDPDDQTVREALALEASAGASFDDCDERTDRRSVYDRALRRAQAAYIDENPGIFDLLPRPSES
jgi:hypothetical protein